MKLTNVIKGILIILLLLALFHMPYGYYELLRFVAMGVFIFLAIESNKNQKTNYLLIFILLALLFQPFHKIALGRTIWNIVDILTAIFLIYTIYETEKL